LSVKNLYLHYAQISLRGQFRYRSTLWMSLSGYAFLPLSMLFCVLVLFARFKSLCGYSQAEVLFCFGVTHCAFSLSEMFARGFDSFSRVLSSGEFDRILVRPRGTVLQLLGYRLDASRVGRLGVGVAVLFWATAHLGVTWDPYRVIVVILMVLGGFALFSGIFMLGACLAFRTTDSLEIVNILTDGGRELCQYPLTIYERWLQIIFTFIIPFGCVNYLPLLFVLGRGNHHPAAGLLPLVGFLFLVPCGLIWKRGVKRYVSTGS
jgi:ABC-2 type transport system permease protein